MDPCDREQTELLRHIWNEMKALGQNLGTRIDRTNERLERLDRRVDALRVEVEAEIGQTNARLDETNTRLDGTHTRLGVVEEALRDLAGPQLVLGRYVKNASDRQSVAIDELRERVTRIEARLERGG